MQILVDLTASRSGRLSGTVQPAASSTRFSFSGTLELLACIEQLVQRVTADADDSIVSNTEGEH